MMIRCYSVGTSTLTLDIKRIVHEMWRPVQALKYILINSTLSAYKKAHTNTLDQLIFIRKNANQPDSGGEVGGDN